MAEKMVYTVKVGKVKPEIVAKYLVEYGQVAEGSIEDQIKLLVDTTKQRFKAGQIPEGHIAECDTCGGLSDMRLTECPYCGDSDLDVEAAAPPPKTPPARTRTQAKAAKAEEAEKPTEKPAKGKGSAAGKKAGKKAAGAGKGAKSKPAEPAAPEAEPEETAAEPEKPEKPEPPPESEAVPEKPVESESEPGGVIEAAGEVVADQQQYTESDLDAAVGNIARAAVETASGLYEYGRELQRVHDLGLWKLRLAPDGKGPAHKSFEQFCREEVKLSRQHAYRLMAVTKSYTEAQLQQYGIAKLHLALQVPEELRSNVLGDGSASSRAVSDRARQLAEGEKLSRQTPPADKRKAVTVAIVPGIVELPMQKRPVGDHRAGELTSPARSIRDEPWFRLPLTNNVFLTVRLTLDDKGEIIAIVEHRRGEESA